MSATKSLHVAVVGAGALGGWTALHLLRSGARVTLLDAWEPGHARASSGGETRVIRRGYGERSHYVPLVSRALEHWRALEASSGECLFDRRGVLWLVSGSGAFETSSRAAIEAAGAPVERLGRAELEARYPALRTDDLGWALFEEDAGALFARRGCEVVWRTFEHEGGEARVSAARWSPAGDALELAGGSPLRADAIVFACGPWMPRLFPDVFGGRVTITRQEVMSFGTPPGDEMHRRLPVWAEFDSTAVGPSTFWYGIPNGLSGGFKLGEDTHGPPFDAESGERQLDPERLERGRAYLAHRFPALAGAPLIDAKICQYTQTGTGDLVLDRLPGSDRVWLLGGGSGHAYKLGPAMGELAARAVLEGAEVPELFRIEHALGRVGPA